MTSARVPLRRVARIVNGGTPKPDEIYWGGDVAWCTPADLGKVDGGVILATDRTLTSQGLAEGSSVVPAQSLVVSTRAPIGYVARTVSPMAFNQGCKGLVLSEVVDVRYLQHWLWASRSQLQSEGTGSTFMELGNESLLACVFHADVLDTGRECTEVPVL